MGLRFRVYSLWVCRLHGQYSIARFNTGSPLHKTGLAKAFCDGPEALARSAPTTKL